MLSYTLTRTGNAPLRFDGEVLVSDSSDGTNANRWHEIAIYRTAGGAYVAAIGYRTQWQGELGHDLVEVCATPEDVRETLSGYDPTAHVAGFPPGEQYAAKQARLNAEIRARYEALVSEVLGSAAEFAETID